MLENNGATTASSEWLLIRSHYSKICSNILQLKVGAEEEPSTDRSTRAALSTALEEWYESNKVSRMILSLDLNDAMRIKLQLSYYYYEAQFQLLSTSLLNSRFSSPAGLQDSRKLLRRSIQESITYFSTIPSEYLLQDWYVLHETVFS